MHSTDHTIGNANRYFKGQMADEEVLAFTRKHWVLILPHLLSTFLIFVSVILSGILIDFKQLDATLGAIPYRVVVLCAVAVITYLMHLSFIKILDYYLRTVIITNMRIIELNKTIFFTDKKDTIDLSEIQDLTMARDGVLQTLLDYGELDIVLSSSSQSKMLRYIPNPNYYFRKIVKTKQAYVNKFMSNPSEINEQNRLLKAQNNELKMADISIPSPSPTSVV